MENKISEAIEQTLSGNRDAYSVIVASYMQRLYAKALLITKDGEAAKDLVQETFIDGYLKLASLRDRSKIEAWLVRILKNKAVNYINRSRFNYTELENITIADNDSPEALFLAEHGAECIRDELNSLSPALRETAILYFIDNMTMEKIAKHTNTPVGTVKRRIHDIRQRLKKEKKMNNNEKLPDSFITEVAEKIEKLGKYFEIHGSRVGFDNAYSNIKELINNLSDKEDIRKYSITSVNHALENDRAQYAEEALALYLKYGEVKRASVLFIDICLDLWDDCDRQISYTLERILPELEKYPDSPEKDEAIASQYFWLGKYYYNGTDEGIKKAKEATERSIELFKRSGKINSYYANAVTSKKALELLRDDKKVRSVSVTAEAWSVKEGNLYFMNQPGFSYTDSPLYPYINYIFLNAGWSGDRWFFPRTIPVETGREENMLDKAGKKCGVRRIVSTADTVKTPAGIFSDCVQLERENDDGEKFNIWYKDGIGIVKISEKGSYYYSTKVLLSYDIKGGNGLLPLEVGNRWNYISEDPVCFYERHEYVIEQKGKMGDEEECVTVSALNYIALDRELYDINDVPDLMMKAVAALCENNEYEKAARKLEQILLISEDKYVTESAEHVLECIREILPMKKANWRFCPSSANISEVWLHDDKIQYIESVHLWAVLGPYGTRHEENRIFGAKPWRYLMVYFDTIWDEKWKPGYKETFDHKNIYNLEEDLTVYAEKGGRAETPAGVFENTLHLVIMCDPEASRCKDGFYKATDYGVKEYWFAEGVGIIRMKCKWGDFLESDLYLTEYHTVSAEGEMMPIHTGNFWRYEEKNLTEENYIARYDIKILSGDGERYRMFNSQMFTWRGSTDEYNQWKEDGCPTVNKQ